MFYFTYLEFQSLATADDVGCMSKWSEWAPMWIGFAVLVCALSYVGYLGVSKDTKDTVENGDHDLEDADKGTVNEHHNSPEMRKVNCWFHFGMMLGSFYVTMILSNWGDRT